MSLRVILEKDFIFVRDESDPFAFGLVDLHGLQKIVYCCRQQNILVYIRTEKGIIRAQKVTLSEPEDGYLEKIEYKDGTLIYIQGEYIRKFE